MVHPRLYWGEAGNDLMPALLELPISRNHRHDGLDGADAVFAGRKDRRSAPAGPLRSSTRTAGPNLHFLAAWWLVCPAQLYLWTGSDGVISARTSYPGHRRELSPHVIWRDIRGLISACAFPSGKRWAAQSGTLQKCAYSLVIFVAAPLMVVTGLAMSPAVTAALPLLSGVFGGFSVGADDSLFRLRRVVAVCDRARRDGGQVRLQASDTSDDRRE